jgi:hypothetical protein
MPTIAVVDGVKIQMFYDDHAAPHFHAIIGGHEVLIVIDSVDILRGSLPPVKLRLVQAWAREHQDALALNWDRCQSGELPEQI